MINKPTILKGFVYSAGSGLFYKQLKRGLRPVGSKSPRGYIYFSIKRANYLAHRLAWLYMTGEWPEGDIDHIDGNPSNNKWENLRLCSKSDNMENQKRAHIDNFSTGLLGAHSNGKPNGKFVAKIKVQGVRKHLGTFDTPEEAHQAYIEAKRQLHSFNTL